MLFEQDSLLRDCVNAGRAEMGLAVNAQIAVAEVVGDDVDHIRFGRGLAELCQTNNGKEEQVFHDENRL